MTGVSGGRARRSSRVITLGLLATMSAISLTGCNEEAKQRRAQECLNGLRDRASEKCREALQTYPGGYSTPLHISHWRRLWYADSATEGGSRYSGGGATGGATGEEAGAVSRGGFGSTAHGLGLHGGT